LETATAVCYIGEMATRPRPPERRTRTRTRRSSGTVQAAARRAVEHVLSSEEAFALLISRLEAAGWRVERAAPEALRRETT